MIPEDWSKLQRSFWEKIVRFALYQERSSYECQEKLKLLECPQEWRAELIAHLLSERYVDDKRFTQEYVYGKFNHKQWGRLKIQEGLNQHRITNQIQAIALAEVISESAYFDTACELVNKKALECIHEDEFNLKAKVVRYMQQKGYELSVIWPAYRHVILGQ
jgi:regulatory protein